MTDSEAPVSPMRLRLGLAAGFVVAIVAAELTNATVPAIGLDTPFDVQSVIVGLFVFALGAIHVTHAREYAAAVPGEVEPTDLQRAGALIAIGGLVLLTVGFI